MESYAFYVWFTHAEHEMSKLAWHCVKVMDSGMGDMPTVVIFPESTTAPEQIKLGRLLTSSIPLLISKYMTKTVVSDIFQYIGIYYVLEYNQTAFWLLLEYLWQNWFITLIYYNLVQQW